MRGNAFTTPDGMCPVCGKTPENGYVRLYEGGREQCVARCHDAHYLLTADNRSAFLRNAIKTFKGAGVPRL